MLKTLVKLPFGGYIDLETSNDFIIGAALLVSTSPEFGIGFGPYTLKIGWS